MRKAIWVLALLLQSPPTSAAEMTFRDASTGGNCAGCEWIAAEGEITPETYKKFLEFPRDERIKDVLLDSPGGSLAGGILLGETFRKLGINTSVGKTTKFDRYEMQNPGECSSACAFAFMGGVNRNIGDDSKLGLHQFYDALALSTPTEKVFTAIDASKSQIVTGMILEYVVRMGVDARVVALASKTVPTQMYYLTSDEAASLKVTWDPKKISEWKIEPYRTASLHLPNHRMRSPLSHSTATRSQTY